MIPDEILASAVASLTDAGIENARREVRLLWEFAADEAAFSTLLERRKAREPMSHILGARDFYKHRFVVNHHVLDPRPDTETLVEQALALDFQRVLDLGTGSGCILLSLLAERPDATGVGVDLSAEALRVADQNRVGLEIGDRCRLIQSDWFENVTGKFDLIVSNPPYIAASEMNDLQPEVRDYEPRLALTDEGDGLGAYRTIIAGLDDHLAKDGHLIVEIGPTQANEVGALMQDAGMVGITVKQDLDQRDRVVQGRKVA